MARQRCEFEVGDVVVCGMDGGNDLWIYTITRLICSEHNGRWQAWGYPLDFGIDKGLEGFNTGYDWVDEIRYATLKEIEYYDDWKKENKDEIDRKKALGELEGWL